ncbi:LPS-assembly protein LptD [Paludibacter sp. 221]|nr:LPS-assembly protein LptD [Paludibacter sp. 221]
MLLLLVASTSLFRGFAASVDVEQENNPTVSPEMVQTPDSISPAELPADSVPQKPKKSNSIDAPIEYTAQDSIVFLGSGTGFLHGQGDVKYKNITLKADFIRVKMDSSLLYARGTTDSIGEVIGDPIFGEGETEYNSKEILYNLKSGKGYVMRAVTQQGEGYIVSEKTKKTDDESLTIADAKYTTCDDHDHPHFYLHIKRGIVKPGQHIVSGPAQLVLADVPLPLAIPFGFFPFSNQYSSGLLMPTFTDELTRGLGLVNGGYYFAFNDYVDMELLGEIYTKGTWAVSARSSYIKKYKFSGNVSVSYREDVTGEKDFPDYQKAKSLRVNWSHRQDAKANPYRTLSASVDFSTSGYNRNNINTYYNPNINSQNTKSSSITFTQRFPNIPVLSLSGGMQVTQKTSDSTIYMSLPNLSVSVSRIYPLKRKNAIGKERWYEKISMSYSGSLANSIQTKENQLLTSSFARDWKNGMRHSIPISASFTLFNYITVTPSFTYNERWHTRTIRKRWDDTANKAVNDTVNGFSRNFDFSGGVTAQTKLYGFYTPIRSIFGDKVDRIRHVLTPSVGFSYNPDFSDSMWGFYDTYVKPDPLGPYPGYKEEKYSIYEGTLYGGPGTGKSGSVNFSLANNLEMKIRNDKDTTGSAPTKIISLIDNFSLSSSYNLMADSMNLSNINANLRLKFGNKTVNLSGVFDPYMYAVHADGTPYKTAEYTWNHGKFPHFLGTQTSYGFTLDNNTLKKWFGGKDDKKAAPDGSAQGEETTEGETQTTTAPKKKQRAELDNEGYEKVDVPWSISINYSVSYRPSMVKEDFLYDKMRYKMRFTHSLSLSGSLTLTNNWRFTGNTTYDFKAKQFTQVNINATRNLHCWTMTASFVPFGYYKSYNFRIGVNASMLQELKYEKRSQYNSNPVVWY